MADEKLPVESVEAPVVTTVEAPVVIESALGPETSTPPAEVKAVEPVVADPAKTTEAPAEVKSAEVKPVDVKAVDVKPTEVKAEEKAPEVKAESKPVELPKYEAFKLPEGLSMDEKQVNDLHSMLGNLEVSSKADHAEVQKFGQAMVEYGIGVINDAITKANTQAQEYWENKTKEYREAFEKDPEIGGSRKGATTEAARQFISQHAGTPEQAAEVRQLLWDHKLADHPSIIRLLANANLARSEGKPLAAQKAVPAKMSKLDKMYGSMKD